MKALTWAVIAVLIVVAVGGIAFRILESGDDSDGGSGVAATPEPGPILPA